MNLEETIRVMIVDDHKVVRSGLSAFLDAYDDLELVAQADSGEKALALCTQHQPDVVLMDLVMPKMNGDWRPIRWRNLLKINAHCHHPVRLNQGLYMMLTNAGLMITGGGMYPIKALFNA